MKNTLLYLFTFFSFLAFSLNNNKTDSILSIIKNSKEDTTYLQALNRYALELKYNNIDTSIIISLNVLKKCRNRKITTDSLLEQKFNNIQINAYSNLLLFYKQTNRIVDAMNLFEEAQKTLNQNKIATDYKANFYIYYANILVKTKDIQGAYNYYIKSRELYEKTNNPIGISRTYFHIGRMYYEENNFKKSIENTLKALDILKQTKSKRQVAFCLNSLASSYSSLAEKYNKTEKDSIYQLAIKYYNLSLTIKKEFDEYNGQLVTLNNLSEIYLNLGDYETALKILQEAETLASKINNPNKIVLSYLHYTRIYRALKQIDKAQEYALKAYKLSVNIGNINYQNRAAKLLSKIYKKQHNYKEALRYYEIYNQINDSILKESHIESLLTNEETFKYKKKNIEDSIRYKQLQKLQLLEIKNNEVQISQKKMWRNWLFTIIISLLLIGYFVVKDLKNKSNAKELLTLKNQQIQEQNSDLEEQKNDLEEMNKSLQKAYKDKVDSIKYARRIQSTTFPTEDSIKKSLPNSFIIYKPLDIVSGDFYWVRQIKDEVVIAVGDSTGHGVPGAFLSIMGIAILKEMVNNKEKLDPAEIMNDIRTRIIESLQHYKTSNSEEHYGMDLGLVIYNKKSKIIQFSGANIPLYIIKDANEENMTNTVTHVKSDKMPISMYPRMDAYKKQTFQLSENDTFFMFTDGTIDQFGGEDGKKIGSKIFSDYLSLTSTLPMIEQKEKLESFLSEWKLKINKETGEHFLQTDDITILGVRI